MAGMAAEDDEDVLGAAGTLLEVVGSMIAVVLLCTPDELVEAETETAGVELLCTPATLLVDRL